MNISLECTKTSGTSTAIKFLESCMQVKTDAVDQFFRDSAPVCSLSEAIYSREPEIRDVVRHITGSEVGDKLAVKALTGQNSVLILCWLFADTVTPTTQERKRWTLMASHLAAGLRFMRRKIHLLVKHCATLCDELTVCAPVQGGVILMWP